MRGQRVIRIIFQRLRDQFWDHDRPGEKHDRLRLLLTKDAIDERSLGDVPLVKWNVGGHRFPRAVGKIIDDRDRPPLVLEREDRMATDVAVSR